MPAKKEYNPGGIGFCLNRCYITNNDKKVNLLPFQPAFGIYQGLINSGPKGQNAQLSKVK